VSTEPAPDRRPWPAYLHGDVVVIPAKVAAFLLTHADLARLRVRARGDDPVTDAVLVALTVAGNRWRTRTSATSASGGSEVDSQAEMTTPSEVMTTTDAARLLGRTSRAVRLALEQGRLAGEQVDGRWRITIDDLDAYRRSRAA